MSSGESKYYCEICLWSSTCRTTDGLFRHHLSVHVDKDDKFRLAYLDRHKSRRVKVQCDYCLKMPWNREVFKHHVTYHSNLAESDKQIYQRHKSRRVAKQCDVCLQDVYPSMLYGHFLAKHSKLSDTDKHICDQCEYVSRESSTLAMHWRRAHTAPIGEEDKKSIQCDICLAEFLHNDGTTPIGNLYRHFLNRHSKVAEKFVCDVCDHTSTILASQWMHYLWAGHLGPVESYRLVCDICGIAFHQKSSVVTHHRRKHGNKEELEMVQCDQCDLSVDIRFRLQAHVMQHNDARYQCEDCERVFKTEKAMFNHKRRDHKEIVYACNGCDKSYEERQILLDHFSNCVE